VASGAASSPISLVPGANLILVKTTSPGGLSSKTTLVVVNRQLPTQNGLSPLDAWRQQRLGAANAPLDQDSDNDRLPHLLEYCFGSNPSVSEGGISVANGQILNHGAPAPGVDAQNIPYVVFGRRKLAEVGIIPEFSHDGLRWEPSVSPPTILADDGIIEACSLEFPTLPDGRKARLFRVRAVQ
jgi:hypothetical protein